VVPAICPNCGVNGEKLDARINFCPQCRWLRPLAPGYKLDCAAFQWAQDGAAMQKLRSIGALNAAARTVSDKVGRPWIEGTFNAVHVSEKQLPKVHEQAVLAARILNLPYLPDVYVSGERMWDAATYGSDTNSFVVLGTALVTSFQGDELLFLLAREMGHCRAGHALWKTVIRFMLGEQGPKGGLMSGGLLSMLSITTLVEGAVELPLLAWARQSEITADRAGLLAVRDEKIVRRVLLTWCLRSPLLFKQINIAEWMKQQEDGEDQMSKLSELALAATPYITRRLKLLAQFARGPELEHWRREIGPLIQAAKPKLEAGPAAKPNQLKATKKVAMARNDLRLTCASCGMKLLVPRSVLKGKSAVSVRCPNAKCKQLVTLKKKSASTPPTIPMPTDTATLREATTYE
jgi:Zn-dependent protease with chaperone function